MKKLNLKKIDFKQFLIEKGEKIGLYASLGFMGLLVLCGLITAVSTASPSQVQRDFNDQATRIDTSLKGQGPAVAEKQLVDSKLAEVDPSKFRPAEEFFSPNTLEDNKRRNPKVLEPTEFQVALMNAPVKNLYVQKTGKDEFVVAVLKPKDKRKADPTAREKRRLDYLKKIQDYLAKMGGGMPGGPGGGAAGGPGGMPGYPGGKGTGSSDTGGTTGPGGDAFGQAGSTEYELTFTKLNEKLDNVAAIAETIQPYRMVIINASFPYKQQVEEFRKALRQKTIGELVIESGYAPQFQGFEVQRQTLRADGTVLEKWKPINIEEEFKKVLIFAVGVEPEDEKLFPAAMNGLTMPRPKLAKGKYPETDLPGIKKTLEAYANLSKDKLPAANSYLNRKFKGDFTIWNPDGPDASYNYGGEVGMPPGPGSKPPTPGSPGGPGVTGPGGMFGEGGYQIEQFVPEYCLVRFIDVTAKPGMTYQYSIRMKMVNPNYGKKEIVVSESLAKPEFLFSPWKQVPDNVVVPPDTTYFVVGKPSDARTALSYTKDTPYVEFHSWMERIQLKPGSKEQEFPFGDWVVHQLPAFRGEFLGRPDYAEVPLWYPTKIAFDFATVPGRKLPGAPKGIAIDFATQHLVVDFEGGPIDYQAHTSRVSVKDEAAVEMLVLTPEGKLIVHNSRDDSANSDREKRQKDYNEYLKALKKHKEEEKKGPAGPGGTGTPGSPG